MAHENDDTLVHEGQFGKVRHARMRDQSLPSKTFLDAQSTAARAAFIALCMKITADRTLELRHREKFKQVQGKLYEFKMNNHQLRVFCFRHLDTWYLVDGMAGKKENNLPKKVVDNATEHMNEAREVLGIKKG